MLAQIVRSSRMKVSTLPICKAAGHLNTLLFSLSTHANHYENWWECTPTHYLLLEVRCVCNTILHSVSVFACLAIYAHILPHSKIKWHSIDTFMEFTRCSFAFV